MSAGDVMYEMSAQMIIIMIDLRHIQSSQLTRLALLTLSDETELDQQP